MRRARGRVDAFQKRVSEIEDRRQALVEEITQQEYQAGVLEDDLFEAQEEEELRKLDWIIERELGELPARELVMPWTRRGEDDRRYRKSLAASLLLCLLFALVFPLIDLPLPRAGRGRRAAGARRAHDDEGAAAAAARRRARRLKPKPEEAAARAEAGREDRAAEAGRAATRCEPEPVEAAKPSRAGAGHPGVPREARAFKEARVSDRLGSKPRINDADDTRPDGRERSMLTTNAPGSSGGINLAALSRNAGGGGGGGGGGDAQGVQVGRATSSIGGDRRRRGDRPLARGGAGAVAHRRRNPDRVRPLQGGALPALQPRAAQGPDAARPDGAAPDDRAGRQRVDVRAAVVRHERAGSRRAGRGPRARRSTSARRKCRPITIVYPIDFLPAA